MNTNSVFVLFFKDCLPSSESRICFFFFGFSLIFEVVSVVIDLFFLCSVVEDYRLLTALKRPGKIAALHTSVFVASAPLVIFYAKSVFIAAKVTTVFERRVLGYLPI